MEWMARTAVSKFEIISVPITATWYHTKRSVVLDNYTGPDAVPSVRVFSSHHLGRARGCGVRVAQLPCLGSINKPISEASSLGSPSRSLRSPGNPASSKTFRAGGGFESESMLITMGGKLLTLRAYTTSSGSRFSALSTVSLRISRNTFSPASSVQRIEGCTRTFIETCQRGSRRKTVAHGLVAPRGRKEKETDEVARRA